MTANDERKRRAYEERCQDDLRLYAWARGLPQITLATKTGSSLHNPKDSDELFVQLYTECLRITHTTPPLLDLRLSRVLEKVQRRLHGEPVVYELSDVYTFRIALRAQAKPKPSRRADWGGDCEDVIRYVNLALKYGTSWMEKAIFDE